jgi:uncharacterized membrane protein
MNLPVADRPLVCKNLGMTTEKNETTNLLKNLDPNVMGAFAYLFPFITGVAFFLIEKDNKFIRFHAVQAVLFWLALTIAWSLASSLQIILIGYFLYPVLRIGGTILWLFLMWKAYNNTEYELPYLGKIAHDMVNK